MGIPSLSISLLLAAAPLTVQPQPMAEPAYRQLLQTGTVAQLDGACRDAARFGLDERLRELRDRLMVAAPAPQPFAVVAANARALLACRAPDSAQQVLSRYGPGNGVHRRAWLLLSWRAAAVALNHEGAILALRRLADGDLTRLQGLRLEVGEKETGEAFTRSALDQLAEHEAALGRIERAASVALTAVPTGLEGAERLAKVARWLETLGQHDASNLLDAALDQAAVAEAWGLAEELLKLQLRLERKAGGDGDGPRARLERLASRVDDRYTLWQLLRDPDNPSTADGDDSRLDNQLRSPREAGGHAAPKPLKLESPSKGQLDPGSDQCLTTPAAPALGAPQPLRQPCGAGDTPAQDDAPLTELERQLRTVRGIGSSTP